MQAKSIIIALAAVTVSLMSTIAPAKNAAISIASSTPTQIEVLAQLANVSPDVMQQRLQQLGVPVQNTADSLLSLMEGDAQKHAQIVAAALDQR